MGISSIITFLSPALENYWGGGGGSPGYGTVFIIQYLNSTNVDQTKSLLYYSASSPCVYHD